MYFQKIWEHVTFADLPSSPNPFSQVGIAESWYEFERETKGFTFKFIPKTSNAPKWGYGVHTS
jgi:hypothetical protein